MEGDSTQIRYLQNNNSFPCCVMNCHYIRYPVEYFFAAMQRYGFSEVEFFGAMPHFYVADTDEGLIDRVLRACARYGQTIRSFTPAQGAYPVSISIGEEAPRRRSIGAAKKGIEAAGRLSAKTMLISPGFGYETDSLDRRWGLCRDALTELGEYAGRFQVTLMIEPLTPPTSNVINTSTQAARMLREVNSPAVKSMLDIGVMHYMGESVDEYFDNLGQDLVHVHFTDGPGQHVALGDGSFPMAEYAEEIKRRGYQGHWSFEINDKRYLAAPDTAMEQTVLWLQRNGFSD